MKWDHWVGPTDHEYHAVMYIKTLFTFRGWKYQLHKMVQHDRAGCFHTHPARAFRLVLWGGYWEQTTGRLVGGEPALCLSPCGPGFFGWVTPEYTHRVASLMGKVSYSLWIRGPITHDIRLVGPGWTAEQRATNDKRVNKVTFKETT